MTSSIVKTVMVAASLVIPYVEAGHPKFPQGMTWRLEAWGPGDKSSGEMVDVDLMMASKSKIEQLSADGHVPVCYISAGTAESWRKDYDAFKPYTTKGGTYSRERWLNVCTFHKWKRLMQKRFEEAADMGCKAIEADNTDIYEFSGKIPGKSHDQVKKCEIEYINWMGETAHSLNMGFGLKNSIDLIPHVIHNVDFAVNESCSRYSKYDECSKYQPFVKANKAVFGVEWKGNGDCGEARKNGIVRKYQKGGKLHNCSR